MKLQPKQLLKYAAMAGGAYVVWQLFKGRSFSQIFSMGSQAAKGSQGNAGTSNTSGRIVPLANSTVSVPTGQALGGDGSTSPAGVPGPWNSGYGQMSVGVLAPPSTNSDPLQGTFSLDQF